MINTGIPVLDVMLNILAGLTAIAITTGVLIFALRKMFGEAVPVRVGADGVGVAEPFGRREGDVHIETLREKQAEHTTEIAVLQTDMHHVDESILRLDDTIIGHRKEQRETNKTMHGKLDTILLRLPVPNPPPVLGSGEYPIPDDGG